MVADSVAVIAATIRTTKGRNPLVPVCTCASVWIATAQFKPEMSCVTAKRRRHRSSTTVSRFCDRKLRARPRLKPHTAAVSSTQPAASTGGTQMVDTPAIATASMNTRTELPLLCCANNRTSSYS